MSTDLKEFISETLVQIKQGIEEANSRIGGTENSRLQAAEKAVNSRLGNITDQARSKPVSYGLAPGASQDKGEGVHFDVAVTVESSSEAKGGGGIGLKVVSLSGEGAKSKSESQVSRVQFSVQIDQISPTKEEEERDLEEERRQIREVESMSGSGGM